MAEYDLGKAKGTIVIDYDDTGSKKATQGLDDLESRLRKTKSSFQDVAQTAGIAAGALAAGIGLAVNAAIDFEAKISAIGAVSGATESDLERLRKKALDLGADTAFSASESASAMEELVKAGLSVEEVLNGAADATVALAAAGGVDLTTAATIASNAMNQFSLAAEDMPHIADLIAGAANASAIDVGQFGFSLSQAGAVAALAGVSFDDLAAAIAIMGNQGIVGSDAGTSLKTMLQNLQPATEKQADLFRELGLVTEDGANQFFNAEGQLKSLAEVSQILQDALAGMTDQQKLATLETLFGSDAIRAAAILTDAGAQGFNDMAAAMANVSAQDVAEQRLNNVAGAIEQLKGSVETAAIMFGTALLPVIRKVVDFITELVNKFSSLDPRWQQLIAFGALAVTILLGVVAALATVGAVVAGVGAAFAAGLGPVLGIIAAVIAAVAALVIGVKLLWDNSEGFRNLLGTLWEAIQTVFNGAVETIRPLVDFFVNKVIPTVRDVAKEFLERLNPAFEAIGNFVQQHVVPMFLKIQEAIQKIMPTLLEIGNFLLGAFKAAWTVLGAVLGFLIPIIAAVAGVLVDILGPVIGFLIGLIPVLWEVLKFGVGIIAAVVGAIVQLVMWIGQAIGAVIDFFKGFGEAGQAGSNIIQGVWDAIVGAFTTAINFIKGIVQGVIDFFATVFGAIWGVIGAPIEAVMGLVISIFQLGWSIIEAIVAIFMLGLRETFAKLHDWIVVPVQNAWNAISDAIVAVMTFIGGWLNDRWNDIKALWDTIYNFIVPPIQAAWDAVSGAIQAGMDAAHQFITDRWNDIKAIWDTIYNFIVPPIQNAWNAVTSFIGDKMEAVRATVEERWNLIKAIWQAAVDTVVRIADRIKEFVDKVRGFFDDLKAAADGGTGELIAFVGQIPGRIIGAIGDLAGLLYQKGRDIIQGLINGIKSMIGRVGDAMGGIMDAVGDFLPGSPAKKGPLSGRGYVLYRGQHLSEDLAAGIVSRQADAARAVQGLMDTVAGTIPSDITLNQRLTAQGATPASSSSTTYGDININVPLEDLRSITDVQDLLDFIDRLRNNSRRGEVTV